MSIFRSNKSAAVQPDFSGLALQTATAAAPIPIVYGVTRVAPNIVWQAGASAAPQYASSGGKGGGKSVSGYEYYTWVMYAIGEGPVFAVGTIYNGQGVYPYGSFGLSLLPGTTPQAPWGPAQAAYPAAALNYNATAYMASSDFDLGSSSNLPSIAFEVYGLLQQSAQSVNLYDSDPASVISDFLTNPQYGVGFPAASLDATTLFGTSGDASYQSYCKASGLAISPQITDQETANSILARWLQLTNSTAVWSDGKLKILPYGDASVSAATTQTIAASVPPQQTIPTPPPPSVQAVAADLFVSDGGVAYASGSALSVNAALGQGQYTVSGGLYTFSTADIGADLLITVTAAPASAYTPDATPVYDLTDDDFIYEDGNDPVEVARLDPYSVPNVQRLECFDRSNQYAATPVEARDQNAIEQFGLIVGSTITAHEYCDLGIGLTAAQLILQRGLYIRNTYSFKLSWECCLLEPMDLVTLTDPGLGLAKTIVRITAIEEDSDGRLAVTAEEFPGSTATTASYTPPVNQAVTINRNVAPAPVNTPTIFEPPAGLTAGTPQIWAAVSGGTNGVADPNWGGANVWISRDGITFTQVDQVTAPARQGVTSAALGAFSGSNPDSADTLAVNLAESGGVLASASAADAANGVTLAIVGTELFAYTTATLTASHAYALTGLYRGLDGSAAIAHPAGTRFARLDGAVFKYTLPDAYIGTALTLKFQSFNIWGGGMQDISTCTAYTYTPIGSGLLGPTAEEIATGTSFDESLASQPATQSDDYGLASDPYTDPLDEGLASDLAASLAVAAGGTGATSAAQARANIGAAASCANGDITSLLTVGKIQNGSTQAITIDPATGHVGLAGYTADTNNALGVLGTAALFAAGTDSFRFTFSKVATANDATLSFQTNFSARALLGTTGSDQFQLKVSPDGSTFYQVYVVDPATGNAAFKALIGAASYTVATLPTAAFNGALAFASNGRKVGEASGAGSGVIAAYSNGAWRRLSDDTVVAA